MIRTRRPRWRKVGTLIWTTPQFGWFVEPSYSYAFTRGHDQNLAVNVGLLFALPPR